VLDGSLCLDAAALNTRDLGVAMVLLGARSLEAHMLGDSVLEKRHAFRVARLGGMFCFSSRLEEGVFNHVSGYGTFATATQRSIDAVVRHYDRVGGTASFEMLMPVVSSADRRLLERSGFGDAGPLFQCHVRTTARPPTPRDVPGLTIERARASTARRYAKLATAGFGGLGGPVGQVFERGWIRQIRTSPRVAAFIGSVDGTPAATGVLFRGPVISGLYSGSVLRRYRGRGIQNAMIAARLAHGWARGVRSFYSWTAHESASARNLRDEGFRTRFEVHVFERT
jgi:ribosomal protein S18 acetylase RimI-like enzyme